MPNVREEFEALVRVSHGKTAANTAAIQALKEFVRAAEKLSNQWPDPDDDDDSFNEGYPKGLPSFDEFVAQLDEWLAKASTPRRGRRTF